MFRTHSPYSPFFTSGLLSEPLTSRPASPDVPLSPTRRGSLPTDNASRAPQEHVSAFYFTLQPRRDEDEFRSYLSLDLAESQSMRSASLKRKASSKAASSRASSKPFRFPPIAETPAVPVPQVAPTPLRMRFSRDSLRTIPSPKPAPSITLPELPRVSHSPPRLPSLLPLPALDLSLPTLTRTSPPRTAPALSHKLSAKHRLSIATKASSSTVSTRARRHNRSEALARLEGRSRSAPLVYPKRNFMSMSDDEDSDDEGDSFVFPNPNALDNTDADADDEDEDSDLDSLHLPDITLHNPLMEPEDMVLPLPSPAKYLEAPRSAPLPPRRRESPPSNSFGLGLGAGLRRQRTRRGGNHATSKDWFPLKSFIDLHNDDDATSHSHHTKNSSSGNWMWRSFIEVANVS
ncbi:hypothetical protein GALMADRAFT_222152 [Galerina marginata CBS 339.88]|uniref:Uncharacterized protein n=1 Tax=Galerina marginata (strain CBS 339.88) TaxID=685588 RepID=A0A067TBP6_GALM3|nr:hypothetical protein GALMADRAFT_222152 [Galerina marginata CBS 339.88]